jgi:hypothetical protein
MAEELAFLIGEHIVISTYGRTLEGVLTSCPRSHPGYVEYKVRISAGVESVVVAGYPHCLGNGGRAWRIDTSDWRSR